MRCCNGLPLVGLSVVLLVASVVHASSGDRAPKISVANQVRQIAYRENVDVVLSCVADGVPTPVYWWKKKGMNLTITGGHYEYQTGTGNLRIKQPTSDDEGEYNCLASNKFGTAVGMVMTLKQAVISAFATETKGPIVKNPYIGEFLRLACIPPIVYPLSSIYFAYNQPGTSIMVHIKNTNRVLLDYDGNLYFANVYANDSLIDFGPDVNYLCVVSNAVLGAYVQGNDYKVLPQQKSGGPSYHAPQLQWPFYTKSIAIKGQKKLLKCIFSGLPTPYVTWRGEDTRGNENTRFLVTPDGFGTEIEFTNVDVTDEGYYTCSATNSPTGAPVTHRIHLEVQSAPWWDKNPTDQYVDEESDVEIDCTARGAPNPNITWFINGHRAHDNQFSSGRKLLIGSKLSYKNVEVNDSQVIQCLSSNEHGTILTNIILKVGAEQPSFIATPEDQKVVSGTSVKFECNVRGAPKPTIEWVRVKSPHEVLGSDGQFVVKDAGRTLEIPKAFVNHTDTYKCLVSNKYGRNEDSVKLTVREPTRISHRPVHKVVHESTEVIIPCEVDTDPEEQANLVVEWQKDEKAIDFTTETHMYMDKTDHSLRIKSSKVMDTGSYTCNATNGLDSAKSNVSRLTVKGRPDPPYDIKIFKCESEQVVILWLAGSDNHDQITKFTVHYSGNFSRGNLTLDERAGADFRQGVHNQLNVPVRPWSQYTFYVTATNSIGTSDLSGQTGKICNTPSVRPSRNPSGVCGNLSSAQQLVITWNPMAEDEYNGEQFHYIVSYKRFKSSEKEETKSVTDPKQKSIAIHGQKEPFTLFEISVRAANKNGVAPLDVNGKKVVRSGEGKPQVVPQKFELVDGTLNGSYAEFTWDPVDTSLENVRGFFRGYRVVFWKSAQPNIRHYEDILIDKPFTLCQNLTEGPVDIDPSRKRRHHGHRHHVRSADRVHGVTNKLWPKSRITAAVQVINQANVGTESNRIEFETPVGVPGMVSDLKVIERGWSHLVVEWQLPEEFTGDIVGYNLEYSVAPPAFGDSTTRIINNPNQKRYKIRRLDYSTRYQIFVAAVTGAGTGVSEAVIGETLPVNGPDAPIIIYIDKQESSANVTWLHSDQQIPVNPGSEFFASYRGPDDNSTAVHTLSPDPSSNDDWVNITGLVKGKYEMWVVARSGFDENANERKSNSWIVHIGLDIPPVEQPIVLHEASAGWFIVLMCIIALLLMVLLIICILRRTRGDMYPVYEKEKMWRPHPLAPEETPFGEYTPPSDNPNLARSQGSLDSDEKPMESDSDSLGEYEDQDASKFNEDGSFIGQYTGKHKSDPMRPAAINTSV